MGVMKQLSLMRPIMSSWASGNPSDHPKALATTFQAPTVCYLGLLSVNTPAVSEWNFLSLSECYKIHEPQFTIQMN